VWGCGALTLALCTTPPGTATPAGIGVVPSTGPFPPSYARHFAGVLGWAGSEDPSGTREDEGRRWCVALPSISARRGG